MTLYELRLIPTPIDLGNAMTLFFFAVIVDGWFAKSRILNACLCFFCRSHKLGPNLLFWFENNYQSNTYYSIGPEFQILCYNLSSS